MNRSHAIIFLLLFRGVYGNAVDDIYKYIFNGTYNKHVRPVLNWNTQTVVRVGLSIVAVIEFDEVKQTLVLTGKLSLDWQDEQLTWNTDEFGNISHIHVPQSNIWKPYIFLENAVTKQSELGTPSLNVKLYSNGSVEWSPTEVLHVTCAADVKHFPFDEQTCSMVFEAYGYRDQELVIESKSDVVGFHEITATAGWSILRSGISTVEEDGADHVVCSLTLKRNPVYFVLNTFLPILLLSWMNVCVFLLPVSSGEKASYVITVFLSLAVFLTIVSGKLPENSESIAMLNSYVFINTLLSVLIAIVTISQIRVYHRDSKEKVPRWLVRVTLVFISLRCCKRQKISEKGSSEVEATQNNGLTPVKPLQGEDEDDTVDAVSNSELTVVTWPDVVKAIDNICLLLFSLINTVVTLYTVMVTTDSL